MDVVEETTERDKTICTAGSSRKQVDSTNQESLALLGSSSLGSLAALPDDADRLPAIFANTSTREEGLSLGATSDANQKSSASLVSPADARPGSASALVSGAELAHKLDPTELAGACANELVDGRRNNVNNGALKGDVMMNKLERKGCTTGGGGTERDDDACNSGSLPPGSNAGGDGAGASQTGQVEGEDDLGRDSVRTTSSGRLDIDESESEQVVDSEVELGMGKEKERIGELQLAIKRQMDSGGSGGIRGNHKHQHHHHDYNAPLPEDEHPVSANRERRPRLDRRGFSMQITNLRKFSDNCSLCRYLISVREAADSKEASAAKRLAEGRMAQRAGQPASTTPEVGAVSAVEVLDGGPNNKNDMKVEESDSVEAGTLFKSGQSGSDPVKRQPSTSRNGAARYSADEFGALCTNALLAGDKYKFEFQADKVIKREMLQSIGCDEKADKVARNTSEMHSEGCSSRQNIVLNRSSTQSDSKNRNSTDSDQAKDEKDEMFCELTDRDQPGADRAANKSTSQFMKSFNRRSMKIFRGLSLDGNKQLSLSLKRINSRLTLGQKKKSQSTKLIVINSENASYTIQGKC